MGAVAVAANELGAPRLPRKTRFPYGGPEYDEVMSFLVDESDALDGYRFDEWLQLLAPEVEYRMPVRINRMPKDGLGFVYEMEFMSEDLSSLQTRVRRLGTKQAWAEQPVSRTRHLITNVRVHRAEPPDEFEVLSNFMVARARWNRPYDFFTGERHDALHRDSGALRLVRRVVYLDQTDLQAHNLSIVL
jgi:3-phenylpropionate/cinnamic acid dioxygenase small subunit